MSVKRFKVYYTEFRGTKYANSGNFHYVHAINPMVAIKKTMNILKLTANDINEVRIY